MKKLFKIYLCTLLVILMGVFGVACRPNSTKQPTLVFEQADFSIRVGEERQLTATGENVVWSIENTAIATISETGLVVAVAEGETKVIVSDDNGSACCKVTVLPDADVPVLKLDAEKKVLKRGSTFFLDVQLFVGTEKIENAITYKSADNSIAIIDDNGVIAALNIGETIITVSYNCNGFSEDVEIELEVLEDIEFSLNRTEVALVVKEVYGSEMKNAETLSVSSLLVDKVAMDQSGIVWSIEDSSVATISNGVVTAVKEGQTVAKASYVLPRGKEIYCTVPVIVSREVIEYDEKGLINLTWDVGAAEKSEYAYLEMPQSFNVQEEEIVNILDKNGVVISENDGYAVKKDVLSNGTFAFTINTSDFIYKVEAIVTASYFEVNEFANQFPAGSLPTNVNPSSITLESEFAGRENVLHAKSNQNESQTGVWYNHVGTLNLWHYSPPFDNGYFLFELYMAENVKMAMYIGADTIAYYDATNKNFGHPSVKVLDEDGNETTFVYNAWNKIAINFSLVSDYVQAQRILFTWDNNFAVDGQTEYYLANMEFMSEDSYNAKYNDAYGYTVSFKTNDTNYTVENQIVPYWGKVEKPADPERDDFVGWYYNGKPFDFENDKVKGDMVLEAKYSVYVNYTVNHYVRTMGGLYHLQESEQLLGRFGSKATLVANDYDNYSVQADWNNVIKVEDGAVYSIYYEHDSYEFFSQRLTGEVVGLGATVHVKASDMSTLPEDDRRENAYYIKKTAVDATTRFGFTYTSDMLGQYLLFNVYYTAIGTNSGIAMFDKNGKTVSPYGYYNAAYDIISGVNEDFLNKWVTVAFYLDENAFDSNGTLYLSFVHNSANTLYYTDYALVDVATFQANFKQFTDKPYANEILPNGVTKYDASLDIFSKRGNTSVSAVSMSTAEYAYNGLIHVTRANGVGASNNEVIIRGSIAKPGNWIVLLMYIENGAGSNDYTWIYSGGGQSWSAYYTLDKQELYPASNGGWYFVAIKPTGYSYSLSDYLLCLFDWHETSVYIASLYVMSDEGYATYFGSEFTVNHILRDGDSVEVKESYKLMEVGDVTVTPNTYTGYVYTETVVEGNTINLYYDLDVVKTYTINHITRTRTEENIQETTIVDSLGVPTITPNTYAGFLYSVTLVNGTTLNVYYDIVGVTYHAATEEGLISARGAGTVIEKVVDGKTTITFNRSTNTTSGNEMMINAAGFTAGNYLVLKVNLTKTHDNPAWTWIQGEAQAWADYKDYAVDIDDSSSNEKGWGYVVFAAPTSEDGIWFYVNWFDWNWLGDIAVEGVYEMTSKAYNEFFGIDQ